MNEQMKEDIRKACDVMQKGGVMEYSVPGVSSAGDGN